MLAPVHILSDGYTMMYFGQNIFQSFLCSKLSKQLACVDNEESQEILVVTSTTI